MWERSQPACWLVPSRLPGWDASLARCNGRPGGEMQCSMDRRASGFTTASVYMVTELEDGHHRGGPEASGVTCCARPHHYHRTRRSSAATEDN